MVGILLKELVHWHVCPCQIEKPVDSMNDDELLESHIQHFKTVRKRCAFNHDCVFQWLISNKSLDVLVRIILICFGGLIGGPYFYRSKEERMRKIARFKPRLALLLPESG